MVELPAPRQPSEQHASGNGHLPKCALTACKLGRTTTCTGCKRVTARVHFWAIYPVLGVSCITV